MPRVDAETIAERKSRRREVWTPAVSRLTKDLLAASEILSDEEARYLVTDFYQMQEDRIRYDSRVRKMQEHGKEPHELSLWLADQAATLENQIKRALDRYTDSQPIGVWLKSIFGVGEVISAGLIAHFDITKAPSVTQFWRFAGLDPKMVWLKGKKRPHNAFLKTLCAFKLGECLVKVQNKDADVYGKLFAQRKRYEQERNERGEFAERAAQILLEKDFRDDTTAKAAYEAGKFPPAHIHAMARRWAVKIFLSHFHHVWHEMHYGYPPPLPYVIESEPIHSSIMMPPRPDLGRNRIVPVTIEKQNGVPVVSGMPSSDGLGERPELLPFEMVNRGLEVPETDQHKSREQKLDEWREERERDKGDAKKDKKAKGKKHKKK